MKNLSLSAHAAAFAILLTAIPSARLAAQTLVLNESFESGKIDPAIWDRRINGTATLAVEYVDGAHGKYALHIHYPDMAGRSYAFIVAYRLPDSLRTHLFGRVYMKITPGLGTTHNPLIFAGAAGWPISKFDEIGTSRGAWMPSYQENQSRAGQGRGEVTYHSDSAPPLNKWFLLEWEFNDNPSSITYWVDGEKVATNMDGQKAETAKFAWPKSSDNVTGLVGGYQEVGFGARVWGAPPAGFDVYYDDIALSTQRVGPAAP